MKTIAVYISWLRSCRGSSALAVALAGLAAVAEGIALASLLPIINIFSGQRSSTLDGILASFGWSPDNRTLMLACLIGFVLLAVLAAAGRAAAEVLGLWIKANVETKMRNQMTDALLRMKWADFITMRHGDISKAMVIEGMQVGTGAMLVVSALGAVLASVCYIAVSFFISATLTMTALAFGLFGGVVFLVASRSLQRHADKLSHLVGEISDRSAELFGNLKYFRVSGMEIFLRDSASLLFSNYARAYLMSQLFNPLLRGVIETIAAVFIAGFLFVHLTVYGGSVAEVIVFLGLFYRMVPRILNAQSLFFQARTYLTWHYTFEARLADARSHQASPSGRRVVTFEQSICFSGVSVQYPGAAQAVLKSTDFTIRKGECVALVGPSGSGKTTVTDVLTGLLQPTSGRITVDGVDLSELDSNGWRKKIGMVMQEPMLIHSTVAANVTMSESDVDKRDVERALRAADAWDFVDALPSGMDTVVAEKGARLSGGQRQRIAIARALYREPELLILDEATSALDGDAEHRVQSVIEKMKGKATLVMVAHRLKTVRMADRIIVLENGRVAESGSWAELIGKRGSFFRMASMQGLI